MMEKLIAWTQAVLNRIPGPGRIFFGDLTADRQAFRSLAACLLAIAAVNLMPPVISLGTAPIQVGLRQVGSGIPILVAANYLLLAILTLAAGATGDAIGRKLFLLIGLAGVLLAGLASMFWLGTDGFLYADLLLNVAQSRLPRCASPSLRLPLRRGCAPLPLAPSLARRPWRSAHPPRSFRCCATWATASSSTHCRSGWGSLPSG